MSAITDKALKILVISCKHRLSVCQAYLSCYTVRRMS